MSPVAATGLVMPPPPPPATHDNTPPVVDERTQPLVPGAARLARVERLATEDNPASVVRFAAAVWNVDCAIVVPFPRTKFVPDNALTTPEVFINVPVVNPLSVSAGVGTVPVNVGDAIGAYVDAATVVVRTLNIV